MFFISGMGSTNGGRRYIETSSLIVWAQDDPWCIYTIIDSNEHVVCGVGPSWSMWTLHWRHNDHDGVSNHQPHGCLLNRLFRRRLKETSKLRVTGLCVGNAPGPVNSPHKGPVTRKMFPFDNRDRQHQAVGLSPKHRLVSAVIFNWWLSDFISG